MPERTVAGLRILRCASIFRSAHHHLLMVSQNTLYRVSLAYYSHSIRILEIIEIQSETNLRSNQRTDPTSDPRCNPRIDLRSDLIQCDILCNIWPIKVESPTHYQVFLVHRRLDFQAYFLDICQTDILLYHAHVTYVAGLVTRTWDKRAFKRLPRIAAKKCELKSHTRFKVSLFTHL